MTIYSPVAKCMQMKATNSINLKSGAKALSMAIETNTNLKHERKLTEF